MSQGPENRFIGAINDRIPAVVLQVRGGLNGF